VREPKAFEKELLRAEVVDQARLDRAKTEADKHDLSLAEVIPQLGFADQEAVYRCLAAFCEMRFVIPSKMEILPEVYKKVPARFAMHYQFVPIQERNGTLVVAVSDPLDTQSLDEIRQVLKRRIEAVVTTPEEILRTTKELYGVGADTMERIISSGEAEGEVLTLDTSATTADLGDASIDASII